MSFQGKMERGSAASTAANSTGSGRSGGLHSGMLVGMGVWAKTADWTPTRLE